MPQSEKNEEARLQNLYIGQRRAVNNAYAALEGEKTVQSFAAFTFEDALDLQIERIEGEGTQLRPNELERVDEIEKNLIKAVQELKEVPVEAFLEADPERDVNT